MSTRNYTPFKIQITRTAKGVIRADANTVQGTPLENDYFQQMTGQVLGVVLDTMVSPTDPDWAKRLEEAVDKHFTGTEYYQGVNVVQLPERK